MHGRVKVRTTEDERERKKKEQRLKVNAYKTSMKVIADKRQKCEYDDEMMEITKLLLLRAPDITTLWNIRKQCILQKVESMKGLAATSNISLSNNEDHCLEKDIQKIFDDELSFTEQCLPANPKSYSTWHQRCWVMENGPCVNWHREVRLCKKYLSLDERNFHTWDYFRYSVNKAQIVKSEELDFSSEQIKVNFSNYSSWHHRSLLLPTLYPCKSEDVIKGPMEESKLREELEMVLTAIFTDPNDSSAWFYQRWLLDYSRSDIALCAFRANKHKAIISFTKSIHKDNMKVCLRGNNDQRMKLNNWFAVNNTSVDCIFHTSFLPDDNLLEYKYIEIFISHCPGKSLPLKFCKENIYYFQPITTSGLHTPDMVKNLKNHLESCENLLKYEPDSKWTLLTSALLMRAIDNKGYHGKTLEYLEKLQIVDHLRKNYYRDVASKWIMENTLIDWSLSKDIPLKLDLYALKELTSIAYPQSICIADEIIISESLKSRYPKLLTFQHI